MCVSVDCVVFLTLPGYVCVLYVVYLRLDIAVIKREIFLKKKIRAFLGHTYCRLQLGRFKSQVFSFFLTSIARGERSNTPKYDDGAVRRRNGGGGGGRLCTLLPRFLLLRSNVNGVYRKKRKK